MSYNLELLEHGTWVDESDESGSDYESETEDSKDPVEEAEVKTADDGDRNPDGYRGPPPSHDTNPGERAPSPPLHPDEDENPHFRIEGPEYPCSALDNPFPPASPFLITAPNELTVGSTYIQLKKNNVIETLVIQVKQQTVDEYRLCIGLLRFHQRCPGRCPQTEVTMSIVQMTASINDAFTFKISPSLDYHSLGSLDEFKEEESYLFIPNEHPERVKLVKYLGKNGAGKFVFDWRWGSHSMHAPLVEDILHEVIGHSYIFRVSWPPEDDENPSAPEPSVVITPSDLGPEFYNVTL
jgi:hypothetical protein